MPRYGQHSKPGRRARRMEYDGREPSRKKQYKGIAQGPTSAKGIREQQQCAVRCLTCDTVSAIFRRPRARDRGANHRKHLWCLPCGRLTLHLENPSG